MLIFLPAFSILQIDVKLSQNNVKIQKVTPLYDKMASQNKYFVLETEYSIMAYIRLSSISAIENKYSTSEKKSAIQPWRKTVSFSKHRFCGDKIGLSKT